MRDISRLKRKLGLFFDLSQSVVLARGEGTVKYRRKLNLGLADPALAITPRDARGSGLIGLSSPGPPTGQPCRVAACGQRQFNPGRILSALG